MDTVAELRRKGMPDSALSRRTFANSDASPALDKCQRYVERWDDMRAEGMGLLLYGETGTGKTHAAACIANALIDREIPVTMTSFPRILQARADEMNSLLTNLLRSGLVVIDDLGAERQTEYGLEKVYFFVDELYKAKKPVIVTTNLRVSEDMAQASDVAHKRIYERVLEMCMPVSFNGENLRITAARERVRQFNQMLKQED